MSASHTSLELTPNLASSLKPLVYPEAVKPSQPGEEPSILSPSPSPRGAGSFLRPALAAGLASNLAAQQFEEILKDRDLQLAELMESWMSRMSGVIESSLASHLKRPSVRAAARHPTSTRVKPPPSAVEEVHSEHSNQSKASHASETAEKAHRHAHEKVTVRVRTLEDVMKGDESGTSSMASMDWVRQKGDALCMGGFDKKPEESWLRFIWRKLDKFVNGWFFEAFFATIIVTNSIFIAIQVEWASVEPGAEMPQFFFVISSIYTFLFTSELLLRILVRGIRIFWGEDWGWMLLDAAIVISSLFEFVIEVIVSSSNDTEQANVFTNMRLLRILRVAKITRAFRIVRLVRFIRSLRTLLLCIGRTLRAMAWSAVLLLLIMFLFALIFTDLCTEHIAQYGLEGKYGEFLDRRAGSLMDSMHTLYASITGGFTWIEVRDAFDDISPAWGLLFEVYIAFCNFAVLNVMTGVFCQSAIESAEKDHELNLESVSQEKEKYFRAVRRLFTQLDQNSDGGITRKEFERAWKDPVLQTVFDALEISSTDAWDLFRQLDRDGSGEVDVDEFLEGCMMIKGPARSIDVVCIKKDLMMLRQRLGLI